MILGVHYWIYIDHERINNEITSELILLFRALFDRVVHLSVSVKKIKFFFKRYLDYEKKHGTPESIQAVKQKAMEYVESKGAEAAN